MKVSLTAISTLLVAGVAAFSSPAWAEMQDTAVDQHDNILTNTFGNCVRTKWQKETDPCAPEEPEPVAAPAPPPPPPAPVIGREERTVYFDFNKDVLTAEATAKLDALVTVIKGSKQIIQAGIVGYADEIGSDEYNIALSQRRAEAARKYLDDRVTIDTRVLEIRGLGESNPTTDCKDVKQRKEKIACLAGDRRVEVEFKYQE